MTEASDLAKYASKANAVFNSVTANSTAITALSVGGTSINATAFAGTANNTSFVGSVSAANVVSNAQLSANLANYQTTAGLSANVATLAANSATYANASVTNTFTIGTAAYFVTNGNFGIGNTSPGYPLTISRAGATDSYAQWTNGGGGNFIIGAVSSGDALLYNAANTAMVLNTNSLERMRIAANGHVGIGTSSPAQKLTVADATSANFLLSGSTTSYITYAYSGFAVSGTASNTPWLFYTNNTERMRIDTSGNVGIGTTSPGSRLHAYGDGAELRAENTNTGLYASGRLRLKGPAGTARSTVLVHGNDNVGGTNPYFAIEGHNSSDSYIKSIALYYHASDYWYFPYQIRAPIFYDSDDTNSYFEGPNLFMRGAAPTIYLRDTDHNSSMVHCNSNLFYILRGGNDTTTATQVNGQWPFYSNLTNNDAVVGGGFFAVGNVTAYYSDRRLKTNIRPITGAIEKLKQINGVYYNNNEFAKSVGYTDDDEQVGVISQEVEKVLPHVVKRAPFDIEYDEKDRTIIKSKSGEDYMTVQYDKLVPLLIEAIKEQQAQIEELQAKIMEK